MLSADEFVDGCSSSFSVTLVLGTWGLEGLRCAAVLSWVWMFEIDSLFALGCHVVDIIVLEYERALT